MERFEDFCDGFEFTNPSADVKISNNTSVAVSWGKGSSEIAEVYDVELFTDKGLEAILWQGRASLQTGNATENVNIWAPPNLPLPAKVMLRSWGATAKGPNCFTLSNTTNSDSSSIVSSIEQDFYSTNNPIGIKDKSLKHLSRAFLVYKLCSIRWLVNSSSSIIRFAENFHLGGISNESDIEDSDISDQFNKKADMVFDITKNCIETIASTQKNSFVAIKITGMLNPKILQNITTFLNLLDDNFDKFEINGKLNYTNFQNIVKAIFLIVNHDDEKEISVVVQKLFKQFDLDNDGFIDCGEYLTQRDFDDYDKMIKGLDEIFNVAKSKDVCILIDAEQSYFQAAIDSIAMKFSKIFNYYGNFNKNSDGEKYSGPIVFNTYQMYTKDSKKRLTRDYGLSIKEKFTFALKLVRGAYMVSERELAKKLGHPDPIHNTLQDTHNSYNAGTNSPIVFMVASHNKESIVNSFKQMELLNISPKSGIVLFGMRDQISYTLGKYGYGIYKFVLYGKIDEAIPYLIRRAQENSSALEYVKPEQEYLKKEIFNRIFSS
nr:12668_t:CDS:2 [Entrophospora candida]